LIFIFKNLFRPYVKLCVENKYFQELLLALSKSF